MAVVFEKLFCSNIVHICFGEDVSDMPIEIDCLEKVGGSKFVRKTLTLSEAIQENDRQVIGSAPYKWLNPIYKAARKLTGIKNFTKFQQTIADNGFRIRAAIVAYVQERKLGKRKSQVENGVDLLSLFLQDTDVFTDDYIVDELRDFFGAAA